MHQTLLTMMRGHPDPTIDRSLAAALVSATAGSGEPIVRMLLARGQTAGLVALVEQYHRLSEESRASVLAKAADGGLDGAIRRAALSTRSKPAENALVLIDQAGLSSLSYIVTGVLRRGDADRRSLAAGVLRRMTERSIEAGDEMAREHWVKAVEEAVVHYGQHRCPEVVAAWLGLLPRRLPGIESAVGEAGHPALGAADSMLRNPVTTNFRRALVPALGVPGLGASAVVGLRSALEAGHWSDVLGCPAGLAAPAARKVLEQEKARLAGYWPSEAALMALGGRAQRGLVAWVRAFGLSVEEQADRLGRLSSVNDPAARSLAVSALIEMSLIEPSETCRGALEGFVDGLGQVGGAACRMAVRRLIQMNGEGLFGRLAVWCNHDDAVVAGMAERALGPMSFDRLWSSWDRLSVAERLGMGRAVMKVDRCFHEHLGGKLSGKDRGEVVRGLLMVGVLGQAEFFESVLLGLLGSARPEVVATAVKAISGLKTDGVRSALKQAMRHGDARVRANAVEALAASGEGAVLESREQLEAMAGEETNRTRANAISALLQLVGTEAEESASVELSRMLHDPRPAYRSSALWVVESSALVDRAAEVAELAVSDEDAAVAARARRTFEAMVGLITPSGARVELSDGPGASLAKITQAESGGVTVETQGAA